MADAVASQTILDGPRNTILKFTNISDGTGESAVIKVNVSTLLGAPSIVSIQQVWYSLDGMGVNLLWDATTDIVALTLAQNLSGYLDFRQFGGLQNNAGTGITGNILFTTVGHSAADRYTIILDVRK